MSEMINWFKRFICITFKVHRRCKAVFKPCQKCPCNYRGMCLAHVFLYEE